MSIIQYLVYPPSVKDKQNLLVTAWSGPTSWNAYALHQSQRLYPTSNFAQVTLRKVKSHQNGNESTNAVLLKQRKTGFSPSSISSRPRNQSLVNLKTRSASWIWEGSRNLRQTLMHESAVCHIFPQDDMHHHEMIVIRHRKTQHKVHMVVTMAQKSANAPLVPLPVSSRRKNHAIVAFVSKSDWEQEHLHPTVESNTRREKSPCIDKQQAKREQQNGWLVDSAGRLVERNKGSC